MLVPCRHRNVEACVVSNFDFFSSNQVFVISLEVIKLEKGSIYFVRIPLKSTISQLFLRFLSLQPLKIQPKTL